MRETVHTINQYGEHLIVKRTLYDFDGKRSFMDKAIIFVIWSGTFVILVALVAGFLWLLGG